MISSRRWDKAVMTLTAGLKKTLKVRRRIKRPPWQRTELMMLWNKPVLSISLNTSLHPRNVDFLLQKRLGLYLLHQADHLLVLQSLSREYPLSQQNQIPACLVQKSRDIGMNAAWIACPPIPILRIPSLQLCKIDSWQPSPHLFRLFQATRLCQAPLRP